MKKILIASTALVAAGMFTTGAASASEKIKLDLGGFSKWWVVGAWNKDSYLNATSQNPVAVDVKGDNEVYFRGSTKLDNGLSVGIDVQLEAGGNTDTRNGTGTDVIDESYVWLESGYGKLIVGSKNNGTYLIHNTAPDAAGNWNEGGILTGDYALGRPAGVARMGQISADLANGTSGIGNVGNTAGVGNTTAILTDGDSEGITYVSPTFYGFTFGASYKPNGISEDNRGYEGNINGAGNGGAVVGSMPVYGAGLLYANTFGGVGVKGDIGYAQYNPRDAINGGALANSGVATVAALGIHGVQREYSTGGQLSYAGFTLGGSYRRILDDKESYGATDADFNRGTSYSGQAWDVGLQYATGPYAVSVAYFSSMVDGAINNPWSDKIEFYQVSGKYALGAGVDVLASAGYADYKDEARNSAVAATRAAAKNDGWVVMTGLSLAF